MIWLDGCKKLFLFFFNTNTSRHRIKLKPRYVEAQGHILSFKVLFVKIGVAVWTVTWLQSLLAKLNYVYRFAGFYLSFEGFFY